MYVVRARQRTDQLLSLVAINAEVFRTRFDGLPPLRASGLKPLAAC